ncbi:MAG: heme biosynthesis protein HemY, partial [Rhizobium sp.]
PLADLRPAPEIGSAQPARDAPVIAKPGVAKPAVAKPSTALVTVTSPPESPKKPEPRPFFGGAPDDPGVRNAQAEPGPKTRLKLF